MNRGFLKRKEPARSHRVKWMTAGLAMALGMAACVLQAQEQVTNTAKMTTPAGYSGHYTVDMGGRVSNMVGSGAMYDTLVNLQSGPRANGETIELRRLSTNKSGLVDNLRATGSGFGGDPYNFAKLSISKGKVYQYNGVFRRDRQYFDYDLLGNPNLPSGLTLPIGKTSAPTGTLAWPQPQHSSDMTNSVRRMYDNDLRLYPLAKISVRLGYAHNIFEGPSLLPVRSAAGYSYNALMEQYQRHLTDEISATVDWKPLKGTLISYEQRIHHYKDESYITLDPNGYLVQEADGTPAYLGNWDASSNNSATPTTSWVAYTEAKSCNTNSVLTSTQFLYPSPSGGRPIIDPACSVLTSYSRSEPTSVNLPSETLRFQSSSIKDLEFNGQFSYSLGNLKVPNFFESGTGLWGTTREEFYGASATGKREVYSGDLGVIWQVTKSFDLADQVTLSANAQPGSMTIPSYTKLTTPTTAGSETINNNNLTTTVVTSGSVPYSHALSGLGTQTTYFGNEQLVNNLTASWNITPKANVALTYRYGNRNIGLNTNITSSTLTRTLFAISEQGVILNAAYRVTNNWDVNGSVEALYDDNAFTTMSPRQVRHYRVHTKFRPIKWATITAAYNDMERHNNTNNANLSTNYGPLDHVDYSRTASVSGVFTPNEHVALNFDYAYGDVYTATNVCFSNMDSTFVGFAGTAVLDSTGAPSVCVTSSTAALWKARAFADAPTQHGTAGLLVSPVNKLKFGLGYRVSDVNGTQFFNDARAVNGSMHSTYQTPYVNIDWQVRPGLIWKAEYNYSGYGEGGASGAQSCTTTFLTAANVSTIASTVQPCATISAQTGMNSTPAGMTAPRDFHANNISLGFHYEF